jgi:hypothetical protein
MIWQATHRIVDVGQLDGKVALHGDVLEGLHARSSAK